MRRLLLLGSCMLLGVATSAQTLVGKLTDASTGLPIADAQVRITIQKKEVFLTTSDASGVFRWDSKGASFPTITFKSFGYEALTSYAQPPFPDTLRWSLKPKFEMLQAIDITGITAREQNPIAFTELKKSDIAAVNEGRDMAFILEQTPGLVTTSDAGAGIGYTGMRIRGSDQTRINVTMNGVPINDAESQGVFWPNMPDLASALNSVQVQRGLGTSTNGPGAFGASVHMETRSFSEKRYAEVDAFGGSFNTLRSSVRLGSGLMKNGFSVDAQLSRIQSDGYIDRAASEMQSYYLSIGKTGKKTSYSFLTFGGRQRTYQAWYGIDPSMLTTNPTYNPAGEIFANNSTGASQVIAYYDGQTDNYRQDHYQFHVNHSFSNQWRLNVSLHYTYGAGFYEEYRVNRRASEVGLTTWQVNDSTTVGRSDYTRELWLQNHFAGVVYNLVYQHKNTRLTFGGAGNQYLGDHFGNVLWIREIPDAQPFEFYQNDAVKTDVNQYIKWEQRWGKWDLFADVQVRNVRYTASGLHRSMENVAIDENLLFFNPKIGFTYQITTQQNLYAFAGMGGREPSRRDYLEGNQNLRPELMRNYEAGWRGSGNKWQANVNFYLMDYIDQLVLTGQLSDVGAPIRQNVGRSYRAGVELSGQYYITKKWTVTANLALSTNKNLDFLAVTAVDSNYTEIVTNLGTTTTALSPAVVGGAVLTYRPTENWSLGWSNRYVSKQYLDNTENLHLPAYWIHDLRASYQFNEKITLRLFVNNLFGNQWFFDNLGGRHYASNGGTYPIYPDAGPGVVSSGAFIFPQATTNFLIGVNIKL